MYNAILTLHSWVRWAALIAVALVFVRSLRGLAGAGTWTKSDATWLKGGAHAMNTQFVLGLILYAVSPYIRDLMSDMGSAMRDSTSRFFAVEHAVIMVLAIAAINVGVLLSRGGATDKGKHARAAICSAIALALVLYGIPWDRPMLR